MKIVYCGRLQDAAGCREAELLPPPEITSALLLRDWLGSDNPRLREALCAPTVRMVVNDELVLADSPIAAGDEIAFMPPVSGG